MTLREQLQELHIKTEKFIADNPGATGVWWEIFDADLNDMRELQTDISKMHFNEYHKRMSLQAHHCIGITKAVIFVYSKVVQVKQHVVIEDVIENV